MLIKHFKKLKRKPRRKKNVFPDDGSQQHVYGSPPRNNKCSSALITITAQEFLCKVQSDENYGKRRADGTMQIALNAVMSLITDIVTNK